MTWTATASTGIPGHGAVAQVWDANGRSLATLGIGHEADSAARLMAAAPDLMDALRDLDERLCNLDIGDAANETLTLIAGYPRSPLAARVRAAVAKATGAQP